ncbi:sugar ABC transporter substrate-binding protein [Paraoerskovia sediminicola]|uniref:Sugar ABC transporter substrate-binding protein n=1 Tax=Paraoerskovia sediminicola TaxID=1138587 RepID=A0ABM8FZ27_9CELL|nr:substrate-binding domain-containing protein [Paraoerskovia sediminicola]BDZ41057.1 sugar ABC transporter substrate-binding protein [Paraoerskovia sediminicola]
MFTATAAVLATGLLLAGCASDDSGTDAGADSGGTESTDDSGSGDAATGKVGVILPDTKSSARWETADAKYLAEAFDAAGVEYDIQNAQGDKTQFQTIADQMITSGVNVLMIVNLDSGSGKAVLSKAQSQGIATIDYDRLTLGGGADYYVSFDNTAVGTLQGEGLEKCLTDAGKDTANIAYLNGSPTDNNATLFKQGAEEALKAKEDAGDYTRVADQAVPDWDNQQAGTIFEQMFTDNGGKIDGVLAANDGLGNAAIAILKKNGVNGSVPVTGQDATDQGLQNILAGDQCMTVYKAVKQEADAASALAVGLAQGEDVSDQATGTVTDTETSEDVASVLLVPQAITFDNVKDVIADGYTTKENVCTAELADKCEEAGIS